MSRNTLATIATIGIGAALALLVMSGAYATSWLLFGGAVQAYEAHSWLTVEFLQGVTRVILSGPVILISIGLFSAGLKLVDHVGNWAKGRV